MESSVVGVLPVSWLILKLKYRSACTNWTVYDLINSEYHFVVCWVFFQGEALTLTGGEHPKTHNRMFTYVTNSSHRHTHRQVCTLRTYNWGFLCVITSTLSSLTLRSHAYTEIVILIRKHTQTGTPSLTPWNHKKGKLCYNHKFSFCSVKMFGRYKTKQKMFFYIHFRLILATE